MCGVFVSLFIYTRIEILTDYKWKWRNLVHCQKSFSPYFKVYKSTGKKWISILLHPSLWLHVLGTFRAEECHLTGMLFEYKLFSFTPSMYLTSVVFQFRMALLLIFSARGKVSACRRQRVGELAAGIAAARTCKSSIGIQGQKTRIGCRTNLI